MMTTFQQRLLALVKDFQEHRLTFPEFQRAYSSCYADENADQGFDARDVEFYGAIHEKAEWTTEAPTDEERGHGWLDVKGFGSWLNVHMDAYEIP